MISSHQTSAFRSSMIKLILSLTLCSSVACDEAADHPSREADPDATTSVNDLSMSDAQRDTDAPLDLGATDVGLDQGPALPDMDLTLIRPRFAPLGADFYDTPWPSDARLTSRGTPDLSTFPTTYPPFLKVIDTLESHVYGFANMPIIYIAFESEISDLPLPAPQDSREASAPIQLIALDDRCGQRVPIDVEVRDEDERYIPSQTLQVKPSIGARLKSAQRYALVVLSSWGEDLGRSFIRPTAFDDVWTRDSFDEETLTRWGGSLIPLKECLSVAGIEEGDVGIATVFTTQDPTQTLKAMRDLVMNPEEVIVRPPEEVERDLAWSRKRLRLTTYRGLIPVPVFQRGEPPYLEEGGGLVFADGVPVIQRWESAPFAISMRDLAEDEVFEGGRPALVFIDGTGWSPWTHLYSRWLSEVLDAGFVVFSLMPQFHGDRAGFTGGPEIPTFNFFNPESGRVNFQQQAVEASFFLRAVREELSTLEGLPEINTARVVYGGHSQGAVAGALNAAVESEYAAYVFNGLSSYLTLTILERKDLLNFELVVRGLLDNQVPLDPFSPALQMMQLGSESVDPHNFAPLWRGSAIQPQGNHVFVINGFYDETTTPRGMDQLTLSAQLPILEPPGWEIDPQGLWEPRSAYLPLAGNETSHEGEPLTLATYLDPVTAHATVYRDATLRQLTIHFWETALRDGLPRLEPTSELLCSDEADGDQDGVIDCADSDCMGQEPCLETRCNDGRDLDFDGLIDCDDPDCVDSAACQEDDCADGLDEDGDGLVDCADPGCMSREPCRETRCRDQLDGDDDGLIDCDDPDCQDTNQCRETSCSDEVDNDRDELIDCDDPECLGSLACPEASCEDGLDNDGDGVIDCADPKCSQSEACLTPREERCEDGLDDDDDGLIDCADPDCALSCPSMDCAQGDLADLTGVAIFQGDLAGAPDLWAPGDCTALGSGGDTPDIALRWTAPADGEYLISTLGSEADTVLTVFSDECEAPRELACHDDRPEVSSSAIRLTITEGRSVIIVISAFKLEDVGPVVLHIEPQTL